MKSRPFFSTTLLCVLLVAGCDATHEPETFASPRLEDGASSLEQLARGIVEAVSARDTLRLARFRVSQTEHAEILWPELPIASEKEHPFPIELAWENIEIRNAAGVQRILAALGGRPLRLLDVRCGARSDGFESFVVLRDCRVTLTDTATGRHASVQLFRSVVVRDGAYKIIRYEREL